MYEVEAGGCHTTRPATRPILQRASGELRVALKRNGSETVLDNLRQAGCLRARFPRRQTPGWAEIVTLNTSGGIAGGDRLDLRFDLGAHTQTTIAAQAAERFYRRVVGGPPAVVRTTITVAPGATAEWLPQETILFDRSAVDRRLEVSVHADARFLGVETLVFGRTAMGETVHHASISDLIRVHRNGTLLLHDAIRLDGAITEHLQKPAIANGGKALGTILYVAVDAEQRLETVRQTFDPACGEAAASAWNAMLIARVVSPDNAALRRTIISVLQALRDDRPLPRVWMC